MTEYHDISILGYFACLPNRLLPNFFIRNLYPKLRNDVATYSLRRLEATLVDHGFDVKIIRPQDIRKIQKIKPSVVGISTVDPISTKPYPWTLTNILGGGKATTELEFHSLLSKINTLKRKNNFKIIIGGPGAIEFDRTEKYHDLFDTYVVGEGEGANDLFRMAINEEPLPKKYLSKPIGPDDYSTIKGPARLGHVQLTQGCPRKCQFCAPSMSKWICFPKEKILKEIEVNLQGGIKQVSLISEDLLLYGSKDTEVNNNAVINLITDINRLQQKYNSELTNISDISFAAALKGKNITKKISDILGFSKENPIYTIAGLETGSENLIKQYMVGKPKPYNPNNWSNIVKDGVNLLNDNYWYPFCTLIIGLPGETDNDVIKTLNLIDDLKGNSLIYSVFFFIPMNELTDKYFFSTNELTIRRWELFYNCWMYSIRFLRRYINTLNDKIFKLLFLKTLNEVEKELKKYRSDPYGIKDTYNSVNLKGIRFLSFLAQRFIN
jgi:radical SAM superfamily enzyme YgiQ (UPF0313 family)